MHDSVARLECMSRVPLAQVNGKGSFVHVPYEAQLELKLPVINSC